MAQIHQGYIRQDKVAELQAEIAKFSRKAVKLGLEPMTLTIDWKDMATNEVVSYVGEKRYAIEYQLVKAIVTGETPKLEGRQFVGFIEHRKLDGPKYISVNGEFPKYRELGDLCDHCGIKRFRTQTFIVKDDKESYKQVGRSCLKDFVGNISAKRLMWWAGFMPTLLYMMQQMSIGGGRKCSWKLVDVVALAISVIAKYQWVSAGYAYEHKGTISTAERVRLEINGMHDDKLELPSEEQYTLSETVIEWAKALEGNSDYEVKLSNVAKQTFIPLHFIGVAVSMFQAYTRTINNAQWGKNASEHVGKVGDKIKCLVKFVMVSSYEGGYGTCYILKFKDDDEKVFIWKTTTVNGYGWKKDDQFTLTGTVKEHNQYKDEKQTVVTRCKVVPVLVPA